MNAFNRIVVILGILLTMAIVTVGLAFPEQSLTVIGASASDLLQQMSRIRPEYVTTLHAGLIIIAIVVDFLLVALLVAELRGPRRKWINVPSVTGGQVSMQVDSIASRLRYHIDPLPDVLSVKPRVSAKRDGVALVLEVEALSEINVPRKAEEILEIARQVIEDKMGLKLATKPQVMIRTTYPPGDVRPAPSAPQPVEAPQLTPPEEPQPTAGDQPQGNDLAL